MYRLMLGPAAFSKGLDAWVNTYYGRVGECCSGHKGAWQAAAHVLVVLQLQSGTAYSNVWLPHRLCCLSFTSVAIPCQLLSPVVQLGVGCLCTLTLGRTPVPSRP